jgi:hypothetical protein
MTATVTQSQRDELVAHLCFSDDTQKGDLLNASATQPNLILALLHEAHKGNKMLITSVKTDHGDDSALGPHGHSEGFSADIWPEDESQLQEFMQGLCTDNPWVTRVGRGGSAQNYAVDPGETIVFDDNSTDHIHLQTGG